MHARAAIRPANELAESRAAQRCAVHHRSGQLCRAAPTDARPPPTLAPTVVLAVLLPLLGLCRRLAYSALLQLLVLSQLACYALVVCPDARSRFTLLPAAYYAVG